MSLPRYPTYKDSGAKWLGEVPEHWEISQSRRMFAVRSEPALASDRMLTASQKYGILFQSDYVDLEGRRVVEVIMGIESLKHVEPNDFIISMRSFQGGIEWCKLRGSTSFHYVMLKPIRNVHPPFFAHLLKSSTYIQALRATTDLIRDGQELRYSNFAQVALPVVPIEEQNRIAVFLDRETTKIDDLVAEQRRLMELLKEKRQAVISHAVTKGLNPDAPMKPSGVEWLGDVPAHWEVTPLKYVVTLRSGGTPSKANLDYWDGDVPWASSKDLKAEILSDTQDHITQEALDDGAADLVSAGSLLIVVRGMILAHTFPVLKALVPMAINQDLKALTPCRKLNVDFLAWLLRGASRESLGRIDEAAHGTKVLRIEAWTSIALPIPPLGEQAEIVGVIVEDLSKLDTLTAEAQRAIDLLQERRTALISAAVTGHIDVRNLTERGAA